MTNCPVSIAGELADGGATGPVTEYAYQMSGGGYHVWNTEPYILKFYPLAKMIEHGQADGGKVYRRRVIVVGDWTEVPETTPDATGSPAS